MFQFRYNSDIDMVWCGSPISIYKERRMSNTERINLHVKAYFPVIFTLYKVTWLEVTLLSDVGADVKLRAPELNLLSMSFSKSKR